MHTTDSVGGNVDFTYSTLASAPNADGSYTVTRTPDPGTVTTADGTNYAINDVQTYAADGTLLRSVNRSVSPNVTCTFDGNNKRVAFPLTPGLSWTRSWHKTCDNGITWSYTVDNTSVLGQETITVGAGTFATNHARFVETETSSQAGASVVHRHFDCWYEVLSNRELRCTYTATHDAPTQAASANRATASSYAVSGSEQLDKASFTVSSRTPPTVGTTGVYQRTVVDNSHNTINLAFTNAITQVNADGSYLASSTTNGGSVATVNGANYTVNTVSSYAANGTLSTLSYPSSGGSCSYATAPQSIVGPLSLNLTWSKTWTENCSPSNGAAAATYADVLTGGQVLSLESVTVPAGDFQAYKVQYTITRSPTNVAAGTLTYTSQYTCWIDQLTNRTLKCHIDVSRTGTTTSTAGYATQVDDVYTAAH